MITASILKNTNRLISSSEDNWAGIRQGTFIRIGKDTVCYNVASVKSFMYIKDFSVIDTKTIKIADNVGVNLTEGDEVSITFKEYELLTLLNPTQMGTGYKQNDIVVLAGGLPVTDKHTGLNLVSSFRVIQVSSSGEILQVELKDKGRYIEAPPAVTSINGGSGQGAVFETVFKVKDDRDIIERAIHSIQRDHTSSIIELDVALPTGIKEGKISSEKWEILLNSNYAGETKLAVPYEIGRDFTPNISLPLIPKGSNATETIVNQAFITLDARIKKLEDQISELLRK